MEDSREQAERPRASGRERILEAAYDLFSANGIRGVGVDALVAEAGVAKMTLYRNFASKDDLALAFLELREQRWTHDWLEREASRRAADPAGRLLAIFDVFAEWFAREDFEGCSFVNALLEFDDREHPVREASARHLATIRDFLRAQAAGAGIDDPGGFARQWHILMKGSIVAAGEGDLAAAGRAQEIGRLLLASRGVERAPSA